MSDQLQADSIHCVLQSMPLLLHYGLKVIEVKTKLQNVGADDPLSTVLIDHGSHAVLPTINGLYSSDSSPGA